LARTCQFLKDYESAGYLIEDAFELAAVIDDQQDKELIIAQAAGIFVSKGDFQRAIDIFDSLSNIDSKTLILDSVFENFEAALSLTEKNDNSFIIENNIKLLEAAAEKIEPDENKAFYRARTAGLMLLCGFSKEASKKIYDTVKICRTPFQDYTSLSRIFGLLIGMGKEDIAESLIQSVDSASQIEILCEWVNKFVYKPQISRDLFIKMLLLLSKRNFDLSEILKNEKEKHSDDSKVFGDFDNLVNKKICLDKPEYMTKNFFQALAGAGCINSCISLINSCSDADKMEYISLVVDSLIEKGDFTRALEISEAHGDRACRISSLSRHALNLMKNGFFEIGTKEFETVLKEVSALREDRFLYRALVSQISRDLIEAEIIEAAESLIRDLQDDMDVSALLGTLAEESFKKGKTEKAMEILYEINDHFQRMISIGKITGLILEISDKSLKKFNITI
jgi:tetratricopeptide (TPR) repeat protein